MSVIAVSVNETNTATHSAKEKNVSNKSQSVAEQDDSDDDDTPMEGTATHVKSGLFYCFISYICSAVVLQRKSHVQTVVSTGGWKKLQKQNSEDDEISDIAHQQPCTF